MEEVFFHLFGQHLSQASLCLRICCHFLVVPKSAALDSNYIYNQGLPFVVYKNVCLAQSHTYSSNLFIIDLHHDRNYTLFSFIVIDFATFVSLLKRFLFLNVIQIILHIANIFHLILKSDVIFYLRDFIRISLNYTYYMYIIKAYLDSWWSSSCPDALLLLV